MESRAAAGDGDGETQEGLQRNGLHVRRPYRLAPARGHRQSGRMSGGEEEELPRRGPLVSLAKSSTNGGPPMASTM
eukprot:8018986-Lingulodinium_polyedra.AAC.1